MSTLIERLRIKAGVMEMGERIAWGNDTALMREAAGKIEALEAQLESVGAGGVGAMMPKQERMAWLPYLSDRADGVKGHYAIARWNPRGYQEVWNLWSHKWSSASEDVLTLEQATEILHRVMMPVVLQAVQESAQVHVPIHNKGAVMNEETLAGELLPCPLCGEVPFLAPSIQERNTLQRAAGWKLVPLEPTTEMLQAGQDTPVSESDEDALEDYKAVYRAMLAAAPHPQQIAGLDKDAEITALKAERDALRKNRHAREDAISGLRDDVEALLAMLPDELRTVFDSAKAKL